MPGVWPRNGKGADEKAGHERERLCAFNECHAHYGPALDLRRSPSLRRSLIHIYEGAVAPFYRLRGAVLGFDGDQSWADKQAAVPKAALKKWDLKLNAKEDNFELAAA